MGRGGETLEIFKGKESIDKYKWEGGRETLEIFKGKESIDKFILNIPYQDSAGV